MELELTPNEFSRYIEQLAAAEGTSDLAKRLGVSRQTVYNMMGGSWPAQKVMEALGARLVFNVAHRSKLERKDTV